MSLAAVEKAMWDLGASVENRERFGAFPDEFLAKYPLNAAERDMLKSWDVRRLTDQGCDPMLAMMTWNAVVGGDQTPEYMRRMNTPPSE